MTCLCLRGCSGHFIILVCLRAFCLCHHNLVVDEDETLSNIHQLNYTCPSGSRSCHIQIQTTSAVCSLTVCIPDLHSNEEQITTTRSETTAVLYTIARDMGWTSLLVVFDNASETDVRRENDVLSGDLISVTTLNINDVDTQTFNTFVSSQYQTSVEKHKYLHVLVCCSQQGLQDLTSKMKEFKKTLPPFTAFHLWSTWVVALQSGTNIVFDDLQLTFTNLAIITYSGINQVDEHTTHTRCDRKVREECDVLHVNKMMKEDMFPLMNHGLNKMNLTVATLPSTTFVVRTKQNGRDVYKGLCMDILEFLSTALHFNYTIVEPTDGLWGKEIEKGKYNGIVGEIVNQKIDFIAAPLIPRQDRVDVMDFTVPYFWDRVVVIFQKPGAENTKWKTLLKPFRCLVFVCVGLSMIFFILCVSFLESVNPFYCVDRTRTFWRLVYQFSWYIYGSLLRQGSSTLPESLTGRVLIGSWAMFCTIIAAAYCTNLVAFLSVNKESPTYKSVADLLRDDALQWGAQGNYYFNMLKHGQDKSLWSRLDKKHKAALLDRNEYLHEDKVHEGNYVFVAHYHHVHAWTLRDCNLQLIVPALSVPVLYTFGFPLHSDFTNLFSVKLMEITESGHVEESVYTSNKHVTYNSSCDQSNTRGRSIDLQDLQTAFYILCAGVVLSVTSLVGEIWASNTCNTYIVQPTQRKK